MAVEVTIPRLGWNMDEGIFVGWLKADGQPIAAGEPLFSLEGDKSTQDIESLEAGILRIPEDGPQPGQTLPVGTVIGYLVVPGESLPPKPSKSPGSYPVERLSEQSESTSSVVGVDSDSLGTARPRISPRARRAADELGVDPTAIRGSGRSGRIRERDVRAAATASRGPQPLAGRDSSRDHPGTHQASDEAFDVVPLSPIRRTIAQRMLLSSQSTAPVTLTTTVDATNLVSLRRQFKTVARETGDDSIGYGDMIVTLTAIAIGKHPMLAARWEADRILVSRGIHIGIAVDTDGGLMVPVIRDVPKLSLRQVAAQSRALVERARAGSLSLVDSQGSSFTVTNLGAFGIDAFTPVINPPECAILGVGRIRTEAVPRGGRFVARDRMTLSLTFDHRIVDGAPAARFLQSLSSMIENPSPWLLA